MAVQSEPCWNYAVSSITIPGDTVTFTTNGFPVSPTSMTTTALPSPPSTVSFPPQTPLASDPPPQPSNRTRNRRHHSKMSAASSSLPNPKELSIEDDWTRVKCPKEKKRIQNRVAQRTYRHRMKARLGELQARLDNHERQRMEQAALGTGDMPSSDAVGSGHLISNSATKSRLERGVEMGSSPLSHLRRRCAMLQDDGVVGSEPAFFPHNVHCLDSPPNSHSSRQAPNGLLSPPDRRDFEQSSKVPQDFVLDYLRFQSQLVNRQSTGEHDAPYTARQAHYGSPNSSLPQDVGMDPINRDHMGCINAFPPPHVHNLDYSLDDWRSDALGLKTGSSPPPMGQMSFPHITEAAVAGFEPMLDTSVLPRPHNENPAGAPSKGSGEEERLESVMRHAHEVGFNTFEDVATAYYKTDSRNSSALSTEQQLSRSRRLPRMISDVYQATEGWSQWERWGFRQEILQTAMAMVRSEASGTDSPLASLLQSNDGPNGSETLESLMEMAQQALPHSWALNRAMVDGGGADSSDASQIALAAMLLQQCCGKVPRERLLGVLEACI
ncbi:hypothetical protein E4U41_006580 [Claviceps citrina]|nr:hypothetical protein E4U41_006580 [Claviceps citrina]